MAKIKLTKGELKRQRDALAQYRRYLPTLQLKKQQLQLEIVRQLALLEEIEKSEEGGRRSVEAWVGLLSDVSVDLRPWVASGKVVYGAKNIAGVEVPIFERVDFKDYDCDLFVTPFWVDKAVDELKNLFSLREEIKIAKEGIRILRHELRIATQRVNLFEKVKIPESEEIIRRVKIYIGDQMANAVGRSKIAKRKIEEILIGQVSG